MRDSENTKIREDGGFLHTYRQVVSEYQGFTLVELILVTILISILTVSFMPKFLDTSAISLEGAAAMVAADIRYTQELAMSAYAAKVITFNEGDTHYTVDSKAVNLPSNVNVSAGEAFNFNSLGEPDAGGTVTIMWREDLTKTRDITVESYTGKVSF